VGFRVDRIAVALDVYVEFAGSHTIRFEYVPLTDDLLVEVALQKNREQLMAAAQRAGTPENVFLF